MMGRFDSALITISFLLLAALFAGCLDVPDYESCGFPPVESELCIANAADPAEVELKKSASNCVIEQPQCPENFCVSFHGSSGFCSMTCETDGDCPDGGLCKEFAFDCNGEEDDSPCLLCVKPSLSN
jgi:hypothetical protein